MRFTRIDEEMQKAGAKAKAAGAEVAGFYQRHKLGLGLTIDMAAYVGGCVIMFKATTATAVAAGAALAIVGAVGVGHAIGVLIAEDEAKGIVVEGEATRVA